MQQSVPSVRSSEAAVTKAAFEPAVTITASAPLLFVRASIAARRLGVERKSMKEAPREVIRSRLRGPVSMPVTWWE